MAWVRAKWCRGRFHEQPIAVRQSRQDQQELTVVAPLMPLCGGLALNGCASSANFQKLGTPPGTYTITVAGASGATQHSVPVTLIVQP